jgi:tripartite-type tricarboxylate transporter receptor subunit TctC
MKPHFIRRACAAAFFLLPVAALAAYPDHAVTMVVPYSAGGPSDLVARMLAKELTIRLGQSFVVENKPGAGGDIGARFVAHAAPDGYTLLVNAAAQCINVSLKKQPGYDASKSFAPITMLASAPTILLANASFPASNIQDLIAMARKSPGQYSYASSGVGTATNLAMELFKQMANVKIEHIPYQGAAPAQSDLLGNHVPLMIDSMVSGLQLYKAGKVKALGMSSAHRSDMAKDIPTIAEQGVPGYEADTWYGIVAPAGTPKPVVDLLNKNIVAILQDPAFSQAIVSLGAEPRPQTPEEFGKTTDAEVAKWRDVIRKAGIQPMD